MAGLMQYAGSCALLRVARHGSLNFLALQHCHRLLSRVLCFFLDGPRRGCVLVHMLPATKVPHNVPGCCWSVQKTSGHW